MHRSTPRMAETSLPFSIKKNSLKNTVKDTESRNLLFFINQSGSREFLGFHVTICETK